MAIYPHLQLLNSQAAEQRNSYLVKLKGSLSYMNFFTFKLHTKLFCWFVSMCNISKMGEYDLPYISYIRGIN